MKKAFEGLVATVYFFVCVSGMAVVMRFSGCVGPPYAEAGDIVANRPGGECFYHSCHEPATQRCIVKTFVSTRRQGRKQIAVLNSTEADLCPYHARCAYMERWPESGIWQAWAHSFFCGIPLGMLMMGILGAVFLKFFSPKKHPQNK